MCKPKKLLSIITVLCLFVITLSACSTPPDVEAIEIVSQEYKTLYNIGEELDTNGIKIKVIYADGTSKVFDIADLRQDIVITNFDNKNEYDSLPVKISYKGKSDTFNIKILSEENSSQKYTVSFVTNSDYVIAPIQVTAYNTVPMLTEEPQKPGYYFLGWYAEASLTNKWNFNTAKIIQDTVLYAKWGKYLKVTFRASESDYTVVRNDIREGEKYNNIPAVPQRNGFLGEWDYNGEWTDLVDNQVIYARYTPLTYTVTFYFQNLNGAEVPWPIPGTFTYGQNVNVAASDYLESLNPTSREHYHLVGWKLKDSSTVWPNYTGYLESIQSDLHIYAVYEQDRHQVTFDFGDASDIAERYNYRDIVYNNRILPENIPAAPERENFAFDGWFTSTEYTSQIDFNTYRVTEQVTVYAKWTRLYTLVFTGFGTDGDDGGDTVTIKVREGATITPPPVKAIVGKTGVWSLESFVNISRDYENIYPIYTDKTYTVKFVNYDNSVILVNGKETQTVVHGSPAIPPSVTPTKDRSVFVRWNADFSSVVSDMVITAEFRPIMYTVTFVTNSDIAKPSIEIASGALIPSLDNLTLDNYDFDGWYKESACINRWNLATDTVEGDTILYAKWTRLHTVYFSYLSGTDGVTVLTTERKVRHNEKLTDVPVMDAITGKNARWIFTADGQTVNFNLMAITEDLYIEAAYEMARFTVIFRSEGVDFYILTEVPYNSRVTAPPTVPQRQGYNFNRWNNNPADFPIVKDTYFDAIFDILTFKVRFIDAFDSSNPVVLLEYSGENAIKYKGIAAAPPNPVHEGYRFIGWDGDNSSITADTDIFARFEKRTYTVTFVSEHDNFVWASYSIEHGEVAVCDTIPTRTGYKFLRWDYEFTPIIANTRIKAVFEKERYTATLNPCGGALNGPSEISGLFNTYLTPPEDPVYEGKAFLGWYKEDTYITKYLFNEPLTSDFSLYAKWEDYIDGSAGIVYTRNTAGDGYTVTAAPADSSTLTIANYYDQLPVTAIGSDAFKNLVSLQNVVLPDTLTFIGSGAFYNCVALTDIVIPSTVTAIGDNAFARCEALTSVTFDGVSQLRTIDDYAFSDAVSLTGFVFPNLALEYIGVRAFNNCLSLTSIEVPASVNEIGESAFSGCVELKYAKFVETAPPKLGMNAFYGRSPFFRVYVANTSQYNSAQYGWVELKNDQLIYPMANMTAEWAYNIIPTGDNAGKLYIVQYIGDAVNVTMGKNVLIGGQLIDIAEIGPYAFDSTIRYLSLNSDFIINVNTLRAATRLEHLAVHIKESFNINKEYLADAYRNNLNLRELSVSAAGMTLSDFFFSGVPAALKVVNILEGAVEIPDGMFLNCQNIEEINLPQSLEFIGERAFEGCISLKTLRINSTNLRSIGTSAFKNCVQLGKYDEAAQTGLSGIPSTVKAIGADAFLNCKFLSDVSGDYVVLGDKILYLYRGVSEIITLPRDIKVINYGAFANKSNIRTIVFDDTQVNTDLTAIMDRAFENCTSLEHVILHKKLNYIGAYAFNNCNKLTKAILFSESVPELSAGAFNGVMNEFVVYTVIDGYTFDPAWQSVTVIKGNIMVYNNWAFMYTDTLSIKMLQYYGASNEVVLGRQFNDGNQNRNVVGVADYAFVRGMEKLTLSLNIPAADPKVFAGITRLNELTLQNSNDTVNFNKAYLYNLVLNNSGLTTLNIGGGVRLRDVFNSDTLPAYLYKMRILDGEDSITDNMFRDFIHITEIEVPASVKSYNVGANAFTGSGFIDAYPGDLVVLPNQKLLVEYKGSDNIITIDDPDITDINRSFLEGNTDVEIIYIGSNVRFIYPNAFADMPALIKVFMLGEAPILSGTVFSYNAQGFELFVPVAYASQYSAPNGWQNLILKPDNSVKSGDYLYEIREGGVRLLQYFGKETTVAVPETVDGLAVVETGNNIFLKDTLSLGINADDITAVNSFTNLKTLSGITVYKTSAAMLTGVKNAVYNILLQNGNLTKLRYGGNITLKSLLNNVAPPLTLTEIEILDGTVEIVENMLAGCPGIRDISIPQSVKTVGVCAFEDTAWFAAQGNFVILLGDLLYKYKGTDTEVIIPASVKVINQKAFANFANGVWSGNARVSIVRFALGSEAEEIKDEAFYGCAALQNMEIPATMHKIAHNAFTNVIKIKPDENGMLIVPGSSSSTLIKYSGTQPNADIVIPATVKYINAEAFKNSVNIRSITFETGSLISAIWEYAFEGCTNLQNVSVPDSVKVIGDHAFRGTFWFANNADEYIVTTADASGDKRLLLYTGSSDSVTIGEGDTLGVKYIAAGAFGSVTVNEVTFQSETPLIIDNGALDNVAAIYVPVGFVEIYRAAWPAYHDKITSVI